MPTAAVGKRGSVVIPKQIRTECNIDEDTELDFHVHNNVIVITRASRKKSRMDENFDRMRSELDRKGVTLELALETLYEMRKRNG